MTCSFYSVENFINTLFLKERLMILSVIALICLSTCTPKKETDTATRQETIVVGIANDFDHLNPLLIQFSLSREVCMLLYPKLIQAHYNSGTGEVTYAPSVAKEWNFSSDGKTATFHLRKDANWQDGTPITSSDFKYSYLLYGNPAIASTRQQYISDLIHDRMGKIDFENAIEAPNDTTLILHFEHALAPSIILDHFYDLMPVAQHIYQSIAPADFRAKSLNLPIISAGAFKVQKWDRQSELVLERNETSVLPYPAKIKKLVFRVIPDYTTRLTAFKSGEIDAMIGAGGIAPKDADALEKTDTSKKIYPVRHRLFDSIVWLCVDGTAYRNTGEIIPHPLFGDKRVRQAMTYAINREAIVEGYIGEGKATITNTSLSPAYKTIFNSALHPYTFNPSMAISLLKEAGWQTGNDGFLQRNGKRFSFTLSAPKGNERRAYAATIIQQNLRDIGVECKIETLEMALFNEKQNTFQLDAALSGLSAETLPFQLVIWADDSPFNSSVFRHQQFSKIISELNTPLDPQREKAYWHEFQAIQHEEQPRTFLYYYDEFEGINRRIQNVHVSMLAILFNAYEWTLSEN